jgi:hypothetical protein
VQHPPELSLLGRLVACAPDAGPFSGGKLLVKAAEEVSQGLRRRPPHLLRRRHIAAADAHGL